jgi:hypothetical protein
MIDTDELQQELDRTQVAFKRWAAATNKAAQDGKNTHTRNMRVASGEAVCRCDHSLLVQRITECTFAAAMLLAA